MTKRLIGLNESPLTWLISEWGTVQSLTTCILTVDFYKFKLNFC